MVLLGKHTENLCFSRQIYPFLKGPDVGFSILGARFEDAQFWGARGPKFPICFYVQYQYPVLSHVKYPCYFKPFLKLDPYVKPTIKNIFFIRSIWNQRFFNRWNFPTFWMGYLNSPGDVWWCLRGVRFLPLDRTPPWLFGHPATHGYSTKDRKYIQDISDIYMDIYDIYIQFWTYICLM